MHRKIIISLLPGLLFACAQTQPSPPSAPLPPVAAAPAATAAVTSATTPESADRFVPIRRVPCERLLQLSNEDRAAAAMFYMGYQASRSGATAINVPTIPKMVSLAMSYCTAYPDRPATEGFAYAYSLGRRG